MLLFKGLGSIKNKPILLFSKDTLNWSKVTKEIYTATKYLFEINAVIDNFLFFKESWNKSGFHKILRSKTIFNCDNNKFIE